MLRLQINSTFQVLQVGVHGFGDFLQQQVAAAQHLRVSTGTACVAINSDIGDVP